MTQPRQSHRPRDANLKALAPATEAQQINLVDMLPSTGTRAVALKTHKAFTKPWFLNPDGISENYAVSIDRETVNQANST